MRILSVGNMFPPHHLGGYELVWHAAVRHLRERGHRVRVLTTDYRSPWAGEEGDPEVRRELRWYWRDDQFPRLSARERWQLERHNGAVFDRHLRELSPELVSWWAMGGMSLSLIERARRTGLPSNAVVCDDWLLYGPQVDAWIRALSTRRLLRRAVDAISGIPAQVDLTAIGPALFPSETTRGRALQALALPDTEVCHQGVDAELFRPAPEKPWGWDLLYVGRIDPRKGIELAVASLAYLPPEARLTVAGAGGSGHEAELRRRAAEVGVADRVRFIVRPRESLPERYANSDAVIFPVLWEEPWGLVPLEAMAIGRPVVASGRGGSGEYLRDGVNCLRFDPGLGPEGLARAVLRLAEDPALRQRLRAGGFETAGAFSEEEWNRAVERLCRRTIADAPAGPTG